MTHAQVTCFSYLASVHTLFVDEYPRINYGVDIDHDEDFLAGDGPLVAAAAAALGRTSVLMSNPVADDAAGDLVRARLHKWGVLLENGGRSAARTRINTVVCDRDGNRTWFSGLRGVAQELAAIDLGRLTALGTVYVDCYEVLGSAPRAVVTAAMDAGAHVMLNLGGSPVPRWLSDALHGRWVHIIQSNADENEPNAAAVLAADLAALELADLVLVTAGRRGAHAVSRHGEAISSPAYAVPVRQPQGAGAAFSAAFLHGVDSGRSLTQCLRFACAAGSWWCGRQELDALPTENALIDLMRSGTATQPVEPQ